MSNYIDPQKKADKLIAKGIENLWEGLRIKGVKLTGVETSKHFSFDKDEICKVIKLYTDLPFSERRSSIKFTIKK